MWFSNVSTSQSFQGVGAVSRDAAPGTIEIVQALARS